MKKKLAFLLAMVLMLTAALTGCGGGGKSDESETYHLKWYSANYGKSEDHDMVFEKISEYTKEKINATVSQELFLVNEYAEKIALMISAGEEIDIIMPENFPQYVSDGVYLPLNDLLEKNGQGIKEIMPDYAWDAVTVNDNIYAIPVIKDWVCHDVATVPSGLVEKYNMDLSNIKSLKDLEPLLQTIKDNEPGIIPLGSFAKRAPYDVFLPVEEVPGTVVAGFVGDDYETVENLFDTKEYREFFDLMYDWNKKGFLASDAATSNDMSSLLKAHKIFMGWNQNLPYLQEQGAATADEGWDVIFLTELKKPIIKNAYVTAATQAIYSGSGNPEKAMDFLNLLWTDADLMNMVVYGIEGQHYTRVDDIYYRLPEGVKKQTENSYYNSAAYQGNRFNLLLLEGEPADKWEKYQEFNEEAEVSGLLGFNFDSTSVINEITSLNNVYQEYIPSLLVGAVNPAEKLPEALEKFKKAGSEKVIAEVQRQYDEWKKNK